jgi:NADH-quinone oxidoreductase subunit G
MTDTAARPNEAPAAPEALHIVIDGVDVEARPGELIIEAAERAGVYIPRFCYHPRMEPVGMCRMCLVEVSGPRGFSLQPACYLKVVDGQEIVTESVKARKAQEGVLEFLLINHPLDCPVCDKGGECPLQDQALSHGPGESRFVEEKRHWDKPIEIGPLVYLDRERCIQCARCTRFADEIAGEALIDFAFRGSNIEVAPFPEQPFTSYFAGNTIQICPVGALTSPAYRFKSRPWDLEQVETTCTSCSVGCRVVAQSSAGALVRYLGVDVDGVNQSWLCDKGRYAIEAVGSANRLREPLVRRGEGLVAARWQEALGEVAAGARQAFAAGGEHAIGVIGGARLSNEDAYAWSKLARTVFKTDDVDCQLGDGLPAEFVLGLPRATINDAVAAKVIVVISGDLREELPVLFLRLRAAAKNGTTIIECSPVPTALTPLAAIRLAYQPGGAASIAAALVAKRAPTATAGVPAAELVRARSLISDGSGDEPKAGSGTVVIIGRPSLAESHESAIAAASTLASAWPGARFLPALRRANVHGALDMGLAPGILPGRVALESARAWFDEGWNVVLPAAAGLDSAGILAAAADGRCKMLVLLGADPLVDFPDRELALAALETVPFLVTVGTHPDESSSVLAHVVLPVAGDGERSGTATNLEGRVSRLAAKVVAPGVSWPAWTVASEIARRLGGDLGFENLEGIAEEIERLAPAYRGVTMDLLARPAHRDGIVLPLAPVAVSIGSRAGRPIDPMATPGIGSVEEQGAPMRVGLATPLGGDAERDDALAEPAGGRPAMLVASAMGSLPTAGSLTSGEHRLVVTRTLYDGGTLVAASPSLAPLAPRPTARLHPSELEKLGVSAGAPIRLRSARGEIVLEARADAALSRDIVAITANAVSESPLVASASDEPVRFGASRLIAAGSLVTDVKVEPLAE